MEIIIVKPAVVRFSHQSVLVTTFFKQMKTVFKVGMDVYDQVNFPDMEGKITKIENNGLITVSFSEYVEAEYVSGGYYYEDQFPTLSTKPYKVELQGFEQKAPAPTFEEAVEWLESTEGTNIMNDSVFLTKGNYYTNLNECMEALRKLMILREYYNEGWQPDWSKENWKYSILLKCVHPIIDFGICDSAGIPHVLSFKTRSIAEKFLKEQKELLITARFLL